MSQIAFFTRDGDMRDRRPRMSHPIMRVNALMWALIRATVGKLTPMGASPMLTIISHRLQRPGVPGVRKRTVTKQSGGSPATDQDVAPLCQERSAAYSKNA